MFFNPWVRSFLLKSVLKELFEKTQMIIQTNTFARKTESCDGIQEACCQTSKTTVSKRWFRFNFFDVSDGFSILF